MNHGGEMPSMPERYTVEKAEGGFILEEMGKEGMMRYVYKDVDELLSDLREDLAGGKESKPDDEEMPEHKKKAKKMTDKLMDMEDKHEE